MVSFTEGYEISDCVNNQQLVVKENSTTTELKTTIALIAVDTNDAASAILLTTNGLYENSTTLTSTVFMLCQLGHLNTETQLRLSERSVEKTSGCTSR